MVQEIATCEDLVEQIDLLGVAQTVKLHRKPPLPTRILRDLHELYHDQPLYLSFLAHYPLIPSDLADQIASDLAPEQTDIAVGLAANPRCPQQALNKLAQHPAVAVRHALAENTNLTPKEFQAMVADENPFVRALIAKNTALPAPLQFVLADDSSTTVQIALASRKNLDLDVAVHLANSTDPLVRGAIIMHSTLDEELLQLWADSDDIRQQLLLLKRKKALPNNTLEALHYSPNSHVRRTALKDATLSGPEMLFLAESADIRDRTFLAEQSDLPASIQRLLAQDASPKVRRRLAANGSINETIAQHIAASNDLGACRMLAKNPATTDATITQLCQHPEDDIALLIAYRDDLDHIHRDLLINQRTSPVAAQHFAYQEINYNNFSETAAEQLATHEAPTLRTFAASSPSLSSATRDKLLTDPSPAVRLALARNPALTQTQLNHLYHDPDQDVVLTAEDTNTRQKQTTNKSGNEPEAENTPTTGTDDYHNERRGPLFNKIVNFFTE